MAGPQVVYVLLRFPCLTETFVAEEMRHIQKRGVGLRIYSLLRSQEELIQPASQELLAKVQQAPGLFSGRLWLAQVYSLSRAPAKYLHLLAMVLRQPAPHWSFYPKRLDIFLKAVWIARQLIDEDVDLIHTHFAWLSTIAGIAIGRLLDIPFTFTAHAYDIYGEKNDLLRLACCMADGIITISDANKTAILAMNPGLPPEKVKVLRCGIDLDSFQAPPARHSRQTGKTLQITSVGRLRAKKGHEYLIRACAELAAQHVDFQCVIVGSGELQHSLRALIDELKLGSRVILAGAQSHDWVRERLCESDLFALACVTEAGGDRDGIPVSIMEAMAMQVPVISTAISGIPELVRCEETGLLVRQRNVDELAAAMMRLATDENLRHKVAQNGLELVRAEYSLRRNIGELAAFFEQTIRGRMRVMSRAAAVTVPVLVGVAGGTGSGKTTVVSQIIKELTRGEAAVIAHDSYYRDRSHLPIKERALVNYDHPDALETSLLVEHLKSLRQGQPVEVPCYDFSTHTRMIETQRVLPCKVIVVEGILILAEPLLRELFAIKIFVDTDADIRFIRRMERDIAERARTRASVVEQYLQTVRPMHLEFVEPSKRFADVIIPDGGYNRVAVDMLLTKLRSIIDCA